MTKVLIVSSDHETKKSISKCLSYNGFTVHTTSIASDVWRFFDEIRFEFIMIDLYLIGESGLSLYKSMRQFGYHVPVIMMGEGEFDSVILKDLALENYDYVIKPIKFNELKLKVNHFLEKNFASDRVFTFGDFQIDKRQGIITFRDKLVQLSKMELDILMMLAQKGGEFIHPKKLSIMFEKQNMFFTMSTFYYVNRLRQKLRKFGHDALDIIFIENLGYRLAWQT